MTSTSTSRKWNPKFQTVPSDVNETYHKADGADNDDAVPMDVEEVTEAVQDVVSSVDGMEVAVHHVQAETDAYDM